MPIHLTFASLLALGLLACGGSPKLEMFVEETLALGLELLVVSMPSDTGPPSVCPVPEKGTKLLVDVGSSPVGPSLGDAGGSSSGLMGSFCLLCGLFFGPIIYWTGSVHL